MTKLNAFVVGVLVALFAALVAAQEMQAPANRAEPTIYSAAELQWRDAAPSLPAGAKVVVLDGDPRTEGSFTMRLKMPAGYRIPPHTHPTAERVTVISGVVHLGIGKKFDGSAGREMKTGDFVVVPPGVPHFAWSTTEAELQIQSEGPFERKFVESARESTNAKK